MSSLLTAIKEWKNGRSDGDCNFRDLFKDKLHKAPYFLRYSLDKNKPDLFMIYITDYSDRDNEMVKECNGIIIDSRDYSIVSYGMNKMTDKTKEYHDGTMKLFESLDKEDNYICEEAEDGAVLTVFKYEDTWVVSTKRNIDANNVRWASRKTFFQLLCDAVSGQDIREFFEKDLVPGNTYSFILLHPENHLVIPHQNVELIYVSKRNNSTLKETNIADLTHQPEDSKSDDTKLSWARPRKVISKDECLEKLRFNKRTDKRGIIISKNAQDGTIERVFVDYKWFNDANHLRKGLPSLHLSYLACSPEEKQKMRQYFGNQIVFDQIDVLLRNLIRYTLAVYKDSYIKKYFKVPQDHPIYKTVRKLHYDYRTTGEPVRIHHVVDVISEIPVHILDSMISYFSVYGFYPPLTEQLQAQRSQSETQTNDHQSNDKQNQTHDEEQ